MTDNNKLYKLMRNLNIVLTVLLLVCLVMIAVLLRTNAKLQLTEQSVIDAETSAEAAVESASELVTESAAASDVEAEAAQAEQEATTFEADAATEDEELFWIETPYVMLGYPAQWESYLNYQQFEENGVYTVSFNCWIREELIPLFDINFGSEQVGELLGYIQKDEKKTAVAVAFHDYLPDETWKEDDTYVLFAMQESVNDLLSALRADEGFSEQ